MSSFNTNNKNELESIINNLYRKFTRNIITIIFAYQYYDFINEICNSIQTEFKPTMEYLKELEKEVYINKSFKDQYSVVKDDLSKVSHVLKQTSFENGTLTERIKSLYKEIDRLKIQYTEVANTLSEVQVLANDKIKTLEDEQTRKLENLKINYQLQLSTYKDENTLLRENIELVKCERDKYKQEFIALETAINIDKTLSSTVDQSKVKR